MAEAHPVGFQWVMEAKAGARRSSTSTRASPAPARWPTSTCRSAPAPTSPSSAASSTTSWSNDLDFRDYVLAYTNAATLVGEDFQDTEDLDGLFSGFDPETRHYDHGVLAVRGHERAGRLGDRDEQYDRMTGEGSSVSESGHGESHGSGGPALEGDPRRDETLQHPRCVWQILKRHYARYTPEMVRRGLRHPAGAVRARSADAVDRQLGPGAHDGLRLRGRLDPAHHRRAEHPRRLDPAAAARQHRPAGRRHHGAARPRQHPGLQRHPDAVRPAARLPPDAARPRPRGPRPLPRGRDVARRASGRNMPAYLVSLLKAYWGDAATADNDYCFDYLPRLDRRPRHLPDGGRPARRRVQGLLPARREPRGRLGQRAGCSGSAWPSSTGWSSATSR